MRFGSSITVCLDFQERNILPSLDTRRIFSYRFREVILHRQHLDKHYVKIPSYYIVQESISTMRWKWSLDLLDNFLVLDSGHQFLFPSADQWTQGLEFNSFLLGFQDFYDTLQCCMRLAITLLAFITPSQVRYQPQVTTKFCISCQVLLDFHEGLCRTTHDH